MSELNGTYKGMVTEAAWYTYEKDGQTKPYMGLTVKVGDVELRPALYFSPDISQRGQDQGKTETQIALELLASYGVECDPENPSRCNPGKFAEAITGVEVSVFCKVADGKQRCYLNRKSREVAAPETISKLWAEMTCGVAPAPAAAAKPAPKAKAKPAQQPAPKDDDDLAF